MQKRIIVSILLSIIVILVSLGIISYLSVNDSIKRSLENRLNLARIIAKHVNSILQQNLTRLYDVSLSGAIDLSDGDWEPEKKAIRTAYQYSIFTDGIFILDMQGNIIFTYPLGRPKENLMSIPYVSRAISERKAIISDIYKMQEMQKNVIFVLVPLKDRNGNMRGIVGGEINLTNYMLSSVIDVISAEDHTHIDLVDSRGTVIASNEPSHIFTYTDHSRDFLSKLIAGKNTAVTKCHRCHDDTEGHKGISPRRTTDMLAFSPLSEASWGIAVMTPEEFVFAPTTGLKKKFLLLGFIAIGSVLVLAIGMSNSIVKPIKSLISATRRITEGDLSEHISAVSGDEIGLLSESFETMRIGLSESLDRIQRYNIELEMRVAERTGELQQNRRRLADLLGKIINAQESERKRIARELHDETSQSLAALGMSIDISAMALKEGRLTDEQIYELKEKVDRVVDGINMLIRDLRPSVLDDLGVESAVRWLLEQHLKEKAMTYHLTVTDGFKRILSDYRPHAERKTEMALFRVIQEAVINIVKHSGASHVFMFLESSNPYIYIGIEDNGRGFNVQSALSAVDSGENVGFGILGMKERIALLGGKLTICSGIGSGTSINITVPVSSFLM